MDVAAPIVTIPRRLHSARIAARGTPKNKTEDRRIGFEERFDLVFKEVMEMRGTLGSFNAEFAKIGLENPEDTVEFRLAQREAASVMVGNPKVQRERARGQRPDLVRHTSDLLRRQIVRPVGAEPSHVRNRCREARSGKSPSERTLDNWVTHAQPAHRFCYVFTAHLTAPPIE